MTTTKINNIRRDPWDKAVMDHPFNLAGMKVGDYFMGCISCRVQIETNAVGVPQCPSCLQGLNRYTVTQADVDAQTINAPGRPIHGLPVAPGRGVFGQDGT